MADKIKERFPDIQVYVEDCQARLDFTDGLFDRILVIHVLEHLPNLPAAVVEMYRLCNKETGIVFVVIPCEGSLAYALATDIRPEDLREAIQTIVSLVDPARAPE